MKYWGKVLVGILAASLTLTIMGCELFERDEPTTPAGITGNAVDMANCYGSEGDPSGYGVFVGNEFFVVNVPKSGVYVIQYMVKGQTDLYNLVVKVKKATMIYIGLGVGLELEDAGVVETEVTVPDSEASPLGTMLVFSHPGWPAHLRKALSEITKIPPGHINIIVNPPSGFVVIIVVKGGKAKPGPTVVILPEKIVMPTPTTSTAVL